MFQLFGLAELKKNNQDYFEKMKAGMYSCKIPVVSQRFFLLPFGRWSLE